MRDEPITLDMPLFCALVALCALSLIILYSAGRENLNLLVQQAIRIGIAFTLMLAVARVSNVALVRWSPYLYTIGLLLLALVLGGGLVGKGAQRWLDLGVVRFQPAEMMKIAVPMMVVWILTRSPLPPRRPAILISLIVVFVPTALVIAQPDLGTAILIASSGLVAIFLAGIGWKPILWSALAAAVSAPVVWIFILHGYQHRRILTLFNPWADPLGAGYHTIQSIIAVGSGGLFGKGWLAGTQSQLDFIPEQSTDFVFSVYAEEFGFIGVAILISVYLFIGLRSLAIAHKAQDSYSRLLGGCLAVTFFGYVFVNIGMTSGLLPVVGVPLPLISQGGSSMVTLMIGFGILMGIRRRRAGLYDRESVFK